jgi:hypothetical protein
VSHDVIAVFTVKPTERLLAEGGSAAWVLDPNNARQCRYLICVRNADEKALDAGDKMGPEPHGAAFLVGRISSVDKVGHFRGRDRYRIAFDAFAEISKPDFRQAHEAWRNPVRYMSKDQVAALGIELGKLQFRPVPVREEDVAEQDEGDVQPLTVLQAKRGLARLLGVETDAVEITIRV